MNRLSYFPAFLALALSAGHACAQSSQQHTLDPVVRAAIEDAWQVFASGDEKRAVAQVEALLRLQMSDQDRVVANMQLIRLYNKTGFNPSSWSRYVDLKVETVRLQVQSPLDPGRVDNRFVPRPRFLGPLQLSHTFLHQHEFECALYVLRQGEESESRCYHGICSGERERRAKILLCLLHLGRHDEFARALQWHWWYSQGELPIGGLLETVVSLAYDRAGQRDDLAARTAKSWLGQEAYGQHLELMRAGDGHLDALVERCRPRTFQGDLPNAYLEIDVASNKLALALLARRGPPAVNAIARSYRKDPRNCGLLLVALGDIAGPEAESLLLEMGRTCPPNAVRWAALGLCLRGARGCEQAQVLLKSRRIVLTEGQEWGLHHAGQHYFLTTRWPAPPAGSLPK